MILTRASNGEYRCRDKSEHKNEIDSIDLSFNFCQMETSLILLTTGFLLMYSLYVVTTFVDKIYWIYIDVIDREAEERTKEIPDSCKHIYS